MIISIMQPSRVRLESPGQPTERCWSSRPRLTGDELPEVTKDGGMSAVASDGDEGSCRTQTSLARVGRIDRSTFAYMLVARRHSVRLSPSTRERVRSSDRYRR